MLSRGNFAAVDRVAEGTLEFLASAYPEFACPADGDGVVGWNTDGGLYGGGSGGVVDSRACKMLLEQARSFERYGRQEVKCRPGTEFRLSWSADKSGNIAHCFGPIIYDTDGCRVLLKLDSPGLLDLVLVCRKASLSDAVSVCGYLVRSCCDAVSLLSPTDSLTSRIKTNLGELSGLLRVLLVEHQAQDRNDHSGRADSDSENLHDVNAIKEVKP